MGLDRTTDAIAHFIGLFELKVEELRWRDIYETFKAKQAENELGPINTISVAIPVGHELGEGKIKPLPKPDPYEGPRTEIAPGHDEPVDPPVLAFSSSHEEPFDPPEPLPAVLLAEPPDPGILRLEVQPPDPEPTPPGSMLTVTIQVAWLSDNDILGTGAFRDIAESVADLAELAAIAQSLHAPWGFGPAELPDAETALAFIEAIASFAVTDVHDFEVDTLRGDDVPAMVLNGVAAEHLPTWSELKPAYHQPEEEDGDETTALPDWALPEEYTANPDMPEGHSLVTGGNLLVNEAHLSVALVDAPVIAVGGSWMDVDLVSQVSAVTNHDSGTGARFAPSSVYQTVQIEETSSAPFWQAGRDLNGDAPNKIQMSVITGDLFISNYVEQVIQMMDNDMFGMSITGANTAYILGDNTVFNATNILTGGFAYDLILVGGNFLTFNAIYQTQVLLDDDQIDAAMLPDSDDITQDDTPGELNLSGLATDGHAEQGIGSNLGKAPGGPVETALSDETTVEDESDWDPVPDNLLMSEARLTTHGVDTRAELSESLADLVKDTEADLEALKERLMSDPALAGLEQARVLKIDGDLIQSNTVKQIILASDRDDIRIDGKVPQDMEIVAGSNALLNAASIAARGVDSVVMAKEEVYSDLLIHQARLIDEPDVPDTSSELVSEAVAFLMEETQEAISQKMADKFAASHDEVVTDSYDVMNGVLV